MGLETPTYISDLVATNPAAGDAVSQGDDHIRNLKSAIKTTFPNINGAVGASDEDLAAMGDGYASIVLGTGITHGNTGFLRRGIDGLCHIFVQLAAGATADFLSNPLLTLPAGYRPTQSMFHVICLISDGTDATFPKKYGYVNILTTGAIHLVGMEGSDTPPSPSNASGVYLTTSFPTR